MKFGIIIFLLNIVSLSSCIEETRPIEVTVRAINEKKKPVTNAHVYINKEFEGRTNSQGYFVVTKEFKDNERAFFEVKKDSESHYYAPYFENKILTDNIKRVRIKATLYSVPKPELSAEVAESTDKPELKPREAETPKEDSKAVAELENIEEEAPPQKEAEIAEVEIDPVEEEIPELEIEETSEEVAESAPESQEETIQEEPEQIAEKQETAPAKALALEPTKNPEPETPKILSFYVKGRSSGLAKADIYFGDPELGQMKKACTTNKVGRCTLRGEFKAGETYTILAKKNDFETYKSKHNLESDGKIHIKLSPGYSIDVFALTSHYGYRKGLGEIQVDVDGNRMGSTDEFGHISISHKGRRGDLIEVSMKSREHLPEVLHTDYIVGGSVSLVKYFSSRSPDPVRVATVPAQVAGRLKGKTLSTFTGNLDKTLAKALDKNFFISPAFVKKTGNSRLEEKASRNWLSLIKKGWRNHDIKSQIDAVLVPTVILHEPMTLEIKLVDSQGKVLAAGKEDLKNFTDRKAISNSVKNLAKKIVRRFPFEGTITEGENNKFKINLGFGEGRAIKTGDQFEVYGIKTGIKGQTKTHTKIGTAKATSTMEYTSKIAITHTEPRSIIDVGDKVVFTGSSRTSGNRMSVQVRDPENRQGLAQANVYFKGKWLGSTDESGRLQTNTYLKGRGLLKVIKHGYETFSKETKLGKAGLMQVPLKRVSAFLRIESEPSNLSVFLDKKFIGKTPFEESIPVPSGFVKLEVLGENGFKNHMQILELDQGTLDLSGDRKIKMEKNFRALARNMINNGKIPEAIELLNSIPKTHSDYKQGQHQAGVVHMTLTNEPAKAAEAFHNVTSDKEVADFRDKRFIGSHINEGVSLHLTAKELEKDGEVEAAMAHYEKSVEILSRVAPQIRFVKKNDYQQAYDNVYYYMALSHQNSWSISKNPGNLHSAQDSWQRLLDGRRKNSKKTALIKNANIYLKQVEIAINKQSGRRL